MRLDGRVAVITGAGSGIGAASALAMAKEGARVVVVDLNEASAKATVEQIEKAGGQALAEGAVGTLTKSLALEAASHGVRVVSIAPVATETPMLPAFMGKRVVDDEGRARYVATVPLGRLNQPEDLARTAVFLASDDAAMITGTCVEVDGGRCI